MKRKVLAVLLAGAMAVGSLVGCGGGSSSDSGASSGSEAEAADAAEESGDDGAAESSGGGTNLTFIMSMRDEFLSTLESGALEAGKELGINVVTQDAQNDTSKQIQFVETAKNGGQKAIIVNPIDPESCQQVVEAAGDAKLVFVNRIPSDTSILNDNVIYVGSDENMSGKYQGDALAEYFKAQGKTDIKYILLNGTIGHTSTTLRTESVLKALADNGINATEATAPLAADFDRATAQDMISPLLKTIEYDCIISNNDAMAIGAIEAMKAAGLDPASVPIVGIDATVDGCQAVKNGEMLMTVFQNGAGQGKNALIAAENLIEGKPINEGTDLETDETGHILWVPFEPVNADNVDDYM